jgi:hypothetical protein
MWTKLWNRVRNWFEASNQSNVTYKELILNEYKSVFYAIHHAHNLNQLLAARDRLRKFQQLLIENHLHYWGKHYIIDLTKLWNVKYEYWKNKMRKQ